MKTPDSSLPTGLTELSSHTRIIRSALLLAVCALSTAWADTASSSTVTPAPAKPFTMYMGADIAFESQGKLKTVIDVDGNAFVVGTEAQREKISLERRDIKIKVDRVLKVSPARVTISELKSERIFTQENDPNRAYEQAVQMQSWAATESDLELFKIQNLRSVVQGNSMISGISDEAVRENSAALVQASSDFQNSVVAQGASLTNTGMGSSAGLGHEKFDAFKLTFAISSSTPISNPYVVVMILFHTNPDEPSKKQSLVYGQKIGPIDSKPKTIRLARSGFAPGYTLDDVRLHLYDGSNELATNVARNRVELTEDEKFQFDVANYVADHRTATLNPATSGIGISAQLRSRLAQEKLGHTYFIKIAKNGMPTGVFTDKACTEKLSDPDIIATLSALRFFPALKEGKAVEAVAPVKL